MFTTLQNLVNLKVTNTRKANLAEKRQDKHIQSSIAMPPLTSHLAPIWVGPKAPPETADETRRIISISDPSKSSSGSNLFHACQERESETLGNMFSTVVLFALFRQNPTLNWVTGRSEFPVLQWRNRYVSF